MEENELQKRLFNFAVKVLKVIRGLKDSTYLQPVNYQLIKSSGSSGANYEEVQAAESRADFRHKINISLKEMRESNYWLRVIHEVLPNNEDILYLINESKELKLILGSISSKVRDTK